MRIEARWEHSQIERQRNWFRTLNRPAEPAALEDFEKFLQSRNPVYDFRLVTDNGIVVANAVWIGKQWAVTLNDVVFVAAMALADSPLRKKALLMQRIANLVQT